MASSFTPGNKSVFCRSALGTQLATEGIRITGIRPCWYGSDCYGAHYPSELRACLDYKKWDTKDKANCNLLDIRQDMLSSIKRCQDMVKNPKFCSQIPHIEKYDFDQLCGFWKDITKYHRRIANRLSKGEKNVEHYLNKKQVPMFYLANENDIWFMIRSMAMCEQYKALVENKHKVHMIKDICVGSFNCKEGKHRKHELVCIDDMIRGQCSCLTKEELEQSQKTLREEIETLKKQLTTAVDEDGFTITLTKQQRKNITQVICRKESDILSLYRKVHYTEQNMVPLNKRIEEQRKTEPKESTMEELQTKTTAKKITKKKFT